MANLLLCFISYLLFLASASHTCLSCSHQECFIKKYLYDDACFFLPHVCNEPSAIKPQSLNVASQDHSNRNNASLQSCHRKTRILFPFTPRAMTGCVGEGGKRKSSKLGTCAAPFQCAFSRMWEITNEQRKSTTACQYGCYLLPWAPWLML